MATMNYSGPSVLVKHLHSTHHYAVNPWRQIYPDGDMLVNDPQPWAESLAVILGSFIVVAIVWAAIDSIILCFRCCNCCGAKARQRGPLVTQFRRRMYVALGLMILGTVAICICFGSAANAKRHMNEMDDSLSDAQDYQDTLLSNARRAQELCLTGQRSTQQLIDSGKFPPPQQAILQDANNYLGTVVRDATSFLDATPDTKLDEVRRILKDVNTGLFWFSVGFSLLSFSFMSIFVLLTYVGRGKAWFACLWHSLTLFALFYSLWAGGLGLALSVGGSDFCMDPVMISDHLAEKQMNSQAEIEALKYYIFCPPSLPHPNQGYLVQAQTYLANTTVFVDTLHKFCQFAPVCQDLVPVLATLQANVTSSAQLVQQTYDLLHCKRLHNDFIGMINSVCFGLVDDWFTLCIAHSLAVAFYIICRYVLPWQSIKRRPEEEPFAGLEIEGNYHDLRGPPPGYDGNAAYAIPVTPVSRNSYAAFAAEGQPHTGSSGGSAYQYHAMPSSRGQSGGAIG